MSYDKGGKMGGRKGADWDKEGPPTKGPLKITFSGEGPFFNKNNGLQYRALNTERKNVKRKKQTLVEA